MTLNMQKKYKDGRLTGRGIEWTDATWNPIAGCVHGCSWLIDNIMVECYAKNVAERFQSDKVYPKGFAHHYWYFERLNSPKKKKKSLKIFVGSMWAIIGAASNGNKYYPPKQVHYDNLIEVLAHAIVPVFLKGNMKSLFEDSNDWREEFPSVLIKKQLEMF